MDSNLKSDRTLSRDEDRNVTEHVLQHWKSNIIESIEDNIPLTSSNIETGRKPGGIKLYWHNKMKSFPSGWMIPLGGTSPPPLLEGGESFWNVFTCLYNPRADSSVAVRHRHWAPSYSIKKVSPLAKGPQIFVQTNFFSLTKWPRWKWHESCPNQATYRR